MLATATGEGAKVYSAIVLACGFVLALGLCFVLRPHFEYQGNAGVVSWISANKYPKQQEMFYYISSLFFVPFFAALVWFSWVSCSLLVSRLMSLPLEATLRKYAFSYLPFILILRKIGTPVFSEMLLIPLVMVPILKTIFIIHDLSKTKLRGVRDAVFYQGSSGIHRGIFASGVCAGFFALIGYSKNPMGILPCLKVIFLLASSVWLLWLLYSWILSAALKRPFRNVLSGEVYSGFPLVILSLIALFFPHRNIILIVSLASLFLVKVLVITKPAWFSKLNSMQFHRYILEYALIPALIYASFYSGGDIHGSIDMFHEGERLAPLNAMLRGQIPFRDIYIQHGLLHNAYRPLLASKLFGDSLAADRMLGHLLAPLRYVATYIFALQIFRSRFFALLAVWILASGKLPASAQTAISARHVFGFIGLAVLVSYFSNQHKRSSHRIHLLPLLVGAFSILNALYSLEIGLYTVATCSLFLLIFSTSIRGSVKEKLAPLFSFAIGAFAAFLPFALYFIFRGAFDDMIRNSYIQCRYHIPIWGVRFPPLFGELSKVKSLETIKAFALSGTFRWYFPPFIYLITLVYLLHQLFKGGFWNTRSNGVVLLLLIGGVISFRTPLGRSDASHLYGIFFAWLICILMVQKLSTRAWGELKEPKLLPAAAWRLALVLVLASYVVSLYDPVDVIRQRSQNLTNYANIERDVEQSLPRAGKMKIPPEQVSQIKAVVDYIQNNTASDETIFDFSSQGAYYFFADRPMATRYHQICYAATQSMQEEVIRDLEKHRTNLVIFTTGTWFDAIDGVPSVKRHPLIAKYLEQNYVEAAKVGSTTFLKRKATTEEGFQLSVLGFRMDS